MHHVLLAVAVLFLLATAASYVGFDSDDIGLAKEALGVVLALGAIVLWFTRRGDGTAT